METKVDKFRMWSLSLAESIDAWRVAPRLVLIGYAYVMFSIVVWYMGLEPYLIEGCNVELLKEKCLVNAPTTQQTALMSAMGAFATAIFAFYVNTSRDWKEGFKFWKKKPEEDTNSASE